MNGSLGFNDTLDNFTFPNSIKSIKQDENSDRKSTSRNLYEKSQEKGEIEGISFDDSSFLIESFNSKELNDENKQLNFADKVPEITFNKGNDETKRQTRNVKGENGVGSNFIVDNDNCDISSDLLIGINVSSFNISSLPNGILNKTNTKTEITKSSIDDSDLLKHIEDISNCFKPSRKSNCDINDVDLFDNSDDILDGSKENELNFINITKKGNNGILNGNMRKKDTFASIEESSAFINFNTVEFLKNHDEVIEDNTIKGGVEIIEKLECNVARYSVILNNAASSFVINKKQNNILSNNKYSTKDINEDSVICSEDSFVRDNLMISSSSAKKSQNGAVISMNKTNQINQLKHNLIVSVDDGKTNDSIIFSEDSFLQNQSISTPASVKENQDNRENKNSQITNNNSVTLSEDAFTESNQKSGKPEAIKSSNQQSQLSCDLSNWNLPEMILQKYAKNHVTKMFEWQSQCLSNREVLLNGKNLVYSAPTSAGKTLVAEILGIKTLVEQRKKVIFVLPFVSVVREKMFHFQDLLSTSGIRVDGFMGSYHPPGGFKTVQLAICTIEKANSLINRLLEENELEKIGAVIIDEIHLLGDPSRGYLLELLLTKLKYMTEKSKEVNIQIIGMSATLPNLELLAKWLNAELFMTSFRPIPLFEQCHVQGEIYDNKLNLIRKLPVLKELETDTDNILQLCLETIQSSCSVLIFCPTKNWCESLAQQTATAFWKLGNSNFDLGQSLRSELNTQLISELLEQLKRCPVGLDKVLSKTVSFGVSFHHAGLTMDERDIIEGGFRSGAIRVLVATSTLSSGVNLPARRVIIRTPNFHGKPLDTLTYRQMIGRAGRMGKDIAGESLLICQKNDYKIAKELMSAKLEPVESCLRSGRLKRAILEVIASGVASSLDDVNLFANCTLLNNQERDDELKNPIEETINFLKRNEFIRLQTLDDGSLKYVATSLGKACLASSLPPEEGLTLFAELEKARQCFVLETELHLIYLVTPYTCCNQWGNIDWMFYLSLWEKLPASMKRVGELVGIRESFMINASRGKIQTNQKLQVHKRFYTALALQDLVEEVPLNHVASKFNCSRGLLQSLQQSASTFAGMVTSFSRQLGWTSVELLIAQFQDRLHFGVNRDLLDLMRLPVMNGPRARTLYNAGVQTLASLASSSIDIIENILHKVAPFESEREREGESKYDTEQRKKMRAVWVTGKQGLTEKEAAEMLINDARTYIQLEMGLVDANWGGIQEEVTKDNEEKTKKRNVLYKKVKYDPLEKYRGVKIGPKEVLEVEESKNLSLSDTSLFESSFKNQKLDSSEVDNLDLKLSPNNVMSNTSSEFIASSQNHLSNFDTPIKLMREKTMTRKRKHPKHDTSSEDSSDYIEETPSKKKKLTGRASKKRNPKIDPSFIISQDKQFTTLMVHETEPKSTDLSRLDIITVSDHEDIFKSFRSEIRTKKEISLSIGCVEIELDEPKIGVKTIKDEPINGNSLNTRIFSYGSREVKGISTCWGGNTAYYISFESSKIPFEDKINIIKEVLANSDMKIRMFDGKEHIKVIELCLSVKFNAAIEDPKIADWILDPDGREKNLQAMAMKYSPEAINLLQEVGVTKGVGSIGLNIYNPATPKLRSAVESVLTWHLVQSVLGVISQLENKLLHAYYIEMSIIRILARMELTGLGVNLPKLEELSNVLVQQNLALERKAFQMAGRTFSFTSSNDVAKILGLYQVKKRVSTSKQVLEKKVDNPIAPLIVQWRKINSILTRTIYPLLRLVKDDRIYGNCIVQNATGRISMHEPNLQSIPRNFEAMSEKNEAVLISCRNAFEAKEKCMLVSADYCQLELRLLAHFSKDKSLVQVMHNTDKDVFKTIASKLNSIPANEITDEMRQNAKQICYGIIYGIGIKALGEQMNTNEEEASQFLETFHEKYPMIKKFIEELVEKCRQDGFVETLTGRRRYLPNINGNHAATKSHAERQAVNTTIQGSAADIAKNAMVLIDNTFKDKFKGSRNKPELVLQIHDEFLYEVPEKYLNTTVKTIKNCMENSIQLSVPFPVKIRVGKTWGNLKDHSNSIF